MSKLKGEVVVLSSLSSQQHKVKLTTTTCLLGGKKKMIDVLLSPTMTLENLVDEARQLLVQNDNTKQDDDAIIELTLMGFIPRPPPLDLSKMSSIVARSVVPHLARIEVSYSHKKKQKTTKRTSSSSTTTLHSLENATVAGTSSSSKKQKQHQHRVVAETATIDLTGSDDEEEEQHYDKKYAPPPSLPPPSSHANPCLDPTTVVTAGDYWIYKSGPKLYNSQQEGPVLGKWLYMALESTVNKYWQAIWPKVVSGELHAAAAKVSTKYGKQQNGQTTYVIIVYTTQRRMDEVGRQFIKFFRGGHISYKTDAATDQNMYGSGSTTQTLKWPLMKAHESLSQAIAAAAKHPPQERRRHVQEEHSIKLLLVGMQHQDVPPSELQKLLQEEQQPSVNGNFTRFFLHREKENEFDQHAIRVDYYSSSSTNHQSSSQHHNNKKKALGYIIREQVKLLSPWIDRELVVIVNDNNNNDDTNTGNNTNQASHRGRRRRRCCSLVSSSSSTDTCLELVVTVLACRDAQKMLEAV